MANLYLWLANPEIKYVCKLGIYVLLNLPHLLKVDMMQQYIDSQLHETMQQCNHASVFDSKQDELDILCEELERISSHLCWDL